ncbi:hypothetical protein MN032_10290 [Agromyces atrinae]|uniref:hypothetical protein n=1 Tax=Agromyces atrinae TaxID=592376 RepID=UPI001F58413A|nr:hypothetical protein [Agromyces atrinae]MCI2958084.1 hypothetical protein [Agromyces atrinae]
MHVELVEPGDAIVRPRFNSETIAVLSEVTSFSEVLPVLDDLRARVAPDRVVMTIDDRGQATYTSMHAAEAEAFSVEADDIDWDDVVAVARYDAAQVARITAALDAAETPPLTSLREKLALDDDGLAVLLDLNARPDRPLDHVAIVQRCRVERDDLVIAALPNGYFTSDADTFENHAVVLELGRHGYRHFGVGASLLAFDRPTPPTPAEAGAVVDVLTSLYGSPASPRWEEIARVLGESRLLLVGYTDGFTEMLAE